MKALKLIICDTVLEKAVLKEKNKSMSSQSLNFQKDKTGPIDKKPCKGIDTAYEATTKCHI